MSNRPLRPIRLLRLANPVVRRLLASRVHSLLSGRLLVLTYHGHRSGRTFSIPLRYAKLSDGRLVTVALRPAEKFWWRSFRSPSDATIVLGGVRVPAVGALAGGAARGDAASAYAARYPSARRRLEDAALVVFVRSG